MRGEPGPETPDTGLDVARSIIRRPAPQDRRSVVLRLATRRDVVHLDSTIRALRDRLDTDDGMTLSPGQSLRRPLAKSTCS
ncbi:hypothetical protein SMC1_00800 [Candidatus Cryosericum septentrionale]|jgi:hypothetical protein|uniref:Uncharacterized protein n=1 Tax=Candidatus Cryosericum septentrionale TaxID=2290913 RepID=A0A398E4E4_9BACT|nr:hypothetical protein SMC1_00800 [Candidatus Cryosericum septentrionale]